MKSIKVLGFATLAALMTMAFVGASSAMGESTRLCGSDAECEKEGTLVTHVHETTLSGMKATLLNSISNVLCDALFLGDVISENNVGSPLEIKGKFTYSNCTDEKPNSCTVTEENGPSTIKVLKEGHETAKVTGEGLVKVVCTGISCKYNGENLIGTGKGPLLSSETNGNVTITDQSTKKVSGLLCPATAKLDITTTPLEATYITGIEGTELCQQDPGSVNCIHTGFSHVHASTLSGEKATLLNAGFNISCDVLFLGDVTSANNLGTPLTIMGNFTYTNCQAGELIFGCTVKEASENSVIQVLKEGHETAKVTGEGEVEVLSSCGSISCTYNGENLIGTGKGPLLSSETNGSVSISEQTTRKVRGSLCPPTAKLDITVTPLIATYIAS